MWHDSGAGLALLSGFLGSIKALFILYLYALYGFPSIT
jgi:hypothetical protein